MRHILDIIKELKVARRLVLPVLSKIGRRDTTISHHYTGDPVRLNCFKHRNYWYMGRRREEDTITLVENIVRPGDTCFDVGANIGYISLILAKITCTGGRVFAFEPDPNNTRLSTSKRREENQRQHYRGRSGGRGGDPGALHRGFDRPE